MKNPGFLRSKTACLPSDTHPGRAVPASAFSTTPLTTVARMCARDPPGSYHCFIIFEKGKEKKDLLLEENNLSVQLWGMMTT